MTQRICVECKWHVSDYIYSDDICTHPGLKRKVNPVSGSQLNESPICNRVRNEGTCGPEGKLFERRVPFWERVLRAVGVAK